MVSTFFSCGSQENCTMKKTPKPQQIEESENYHIFSFWRHGNLGICWLLGEEFGTEDWSMQPGSRSGEDICCFHELGWSKPLVSSVKRGLRYCTEYMLQCHWIQPLSWTWSFICIICVDFIGDNPLFRFMPPQYLSFRVRWNMFTVVLSIKIVY